MRRQKPSLLKRDRLKNECPIKEKNCVLQAKAKVKKIFDCMLLLRECGDFVVSDVVFEVGMCSMLRYGATNCFIYTANS
jgi:hypothetical protein